MFPVDSQKHLIRNYLVSTGTSYTIVPTVVCDGFKIVQNENINFLNGKNEGSYSNQGDDCNSRTALLLVIKHLNKDCGI